MSKQCWMGRDRDGQRKAGKRVCPTSPAQASRYSERRRNSASVTMKARDLTPFGLSVGVGPPVGSRERDKQQYTDASR